MLSGRAREKCWMRVLLETYSNIDFLMEDLSSLAEGSSLSLVEDRSDLFASINSGYFIS